MELLELLALRWFVKVLATAEYVRVPEGLGALGTREDWSTTKLFWQPNKFACLKSIWSVVKTTDLQYFLDANANSLAFCCMSGTNTHTQTHNNKEFKACMRQDIHDGSKDYVVHLSTTCPTWGLQMRGACQTWAVFEFGWQVANPCDEDNSLGVQSSQAQEPNICNLPALQVSCCLKPRFALGFWSWKDHCGGFELNILKLQNDQQGVAFLNKSPYQR